MINVGITPLQNKILSINLDSIKMNLGGSHLIVVSNSDNKVLSYSTLDPTVATVSATGLVTIQGYGDTSIIVSDGERQASVYVEIPTGLNSRSIYYGIISNDITALTIADVVNYVKNGTLKSIPLQETKILQETPGNFVVLVPNKDYECYKMDNTLTYFKHKGERMVGEFFIYGEAITEECVARVVNKKLESNLSEVQKLQLVNAVKDIIKEYGGGNSQNQDNNSEPLCTIQLNPKPTEGIIYTPIVQMFDSPVLFDIKKNININFIDETNQSFLINFNYMGNEDAGEEFKFHVYEGFKLTNSVDKKLSRLFIVEEENYILGILGLIFESDNPNEITIRIDEDILNDGYNKRFEDNLGEIGAFINVPFINKINILYKSRNYRDNKIICSNIYSTYDDSGDGYTYDTIIHGNSDMYRVYLYIGNDKSIYLQINKINKS